MALDPVPWIVGGGAVHSPDVARAMAYVALGGKEGIVGTGSGKVTSAGGANVSVAAGAFAIENSYPGGADQMYVGREVSSSTVSVPATGGVPRSDLLVVRIDDPQFGGSTPSDPTVGPYIKYALISNVGSSAVDVPGGTAYPALPLARIDIPASTSVITDAMITDLRGEKGVAGVPLYKKETRSYAPVTETALTAPAPGVAWPNAAGWQVAIPEWATKMSGRVTLTGIRIDATTPNAYGKIWVTIGGTLFVSEQTRYDQPSGGGRQRLTLVAGFADDVVPASIRGTTQTVKVMAQKEGGSGSESLEAEASSVVFLDMEFFEEPA